MSNMEIQKRKFTLTQKVGIGLITIGITTAASSPFIAHKLAPLKEDIVIKENRVGLRIIKALPHVGPYTLIGNKGILPTKFLETAVAKPVSKRASVFASLCTLGTLFVVTGGALVVGNGEKKQ